MDVKLDGWIQSCINGEFHQMLDGRTSQVNAQDRIVQLENNCYPSIWVVSIDEEIKQPTEDYYIYLLFIQIFYILFVLYFI